MSPLATPKFSIVNFQLSIGSHRLPDKWEFDFFIQKEHRSVERCLFVAFGVGGQTQ